MVFQPSTNKHIFTYCDQQCQYGVTICSVSTVVLTFDLWYGKLISAFHEYCAFILFSLSNILLALSQPVSFLCVCVCVWVSEWWSRSGQDMQWQCEVRITDPCVCVCVCVWHPPAAETDAETPFESTWDSRKNARPNTHTHAHWSLALTQMHTHKCTRKSICKQTKNVSDCSHLISGRYFSDFCWVWISWLTLMSSKMWLSWRSNLYVLLSYTKQKRRQCLHCCFPYNESIQNPFNLKWYKKEGRNMWFILLSKV